jgi:hypothetical protein
MSRKRNLKPAILVALTITLATACQLSRFLLGVTEGLQAEYFAAEQPGGVPSVTIIDRHVSTTRLHEAWQGAAPAVFSARWSGFLTVWRNGIYTFATTSDDGSSVTINGWRIVENGGAHVSLTKSGRVQLTRGTYPILIEYVQYGGDYSMGWTWARDGAGLSPVPAWVLSPRRFSLPKVMAARVLGLAAFALAGTALLLTVRTWVRRSMVRRHPRVATLALFVVMAIVHTWPLASDPVHLSRNDNGDTILNEWIIAWVAHQAPRAPLQLFDANIFHPERDTLAYSESMLVQSALAAPVLWLGGSPVLAYNIVLLAGFALTGWTMCLVVARWTGSWTAGLVSGMVFAFSAHVLTRIPHLQAQHVEFLPLAVFALDRVLAGPTVRRALPLAAWFTLQALTSVYLMVFTTAAMIAAAAVRADLWVRAKHVMPILALAGAAAALALMPFLLPYWRVSHDQGLSRSLADAAFYSATWQDYLSTPARLHYPWWSHRYFAETALFPGALGLVLAGVALASGTGYTDPRARMCLAIGIAGVALSFGPKLPGYAILYETVPLLRAIRATARFGHLATFAVAALAGFGVVVLRRRISPQRWGFAAVLLVTVAALESFAAPLGLTWVGDVAAIYSRVSSSGGAVVELPFYNGAAAFHHAKYMLNSTAHWRPLVNGYSGFQPPSFYRHVEALAGFPDRRSVAMLKELGVTHVFVHRQYFPAAAMDRLNDFPELSLVDTSGTIALYRLHP